MEKLIKIEKQFLLDCKNSLCKIKSGKVKGFGFFTELDEEYIPFSECLLTSTEILDEDYIKNKKEIILDFQNSEKILQINERKIFSNKDLGYICIEILNDDEIEDFLYIEGRIEKEGREPYINKDIFIPKFEENNNISFESGEIKSFEKDKIIHNCSLKEDTIGAPIISPDLYLNVMGIIKGYDANSKSYIGIPFIDIIKNILYNISPIAFHDDNKGEFLTEEILEIAKFYSKIDESSFLSIISQKFSEKSIPRLALEFAKHLESIDIYEEYQKELINNFSRKTRIIYDSNKDDDIIMNVFSKVYGKTNLACFYNLFYPDDYEKEKKVESRNLSFLKGKVEFNNNNFEFEHSDVFIYGTFAQYYTSYDYISYKAQNTSIFYKIKDGSIYVIFYREYSQSKTVKLMIKIGNNFMKNKIQYIDDGDYNDLVTETVEKNNTFDNIDELFENCDNSKKLEADFKELIIYEFDN